jgi:DnaJ domain
MLAFILGIVVLVLLLFAIKSFSKTDPKQLARLLRYIGGGVALLIAAFLFLRGQIGPAVSIGLLGLGLFGYLTLWPASLGARTQKTAGQVSRVRTKFLEMELDLDSGSIRGRVLEGRYQGAALDDLDLSALIAILADMDDDSSQLLTAYLDRKHPRWREQSSGDDAEKTRGRDSRNTRMTEEEAYQILGLPPGASVEDVARAHRSLMKKLHPDQGGSTYLAARINEAKEVLTRGKR